MKQCLLIPINAFRDFRRGVPSTTNDQGYETVALDSQHGADDVEVGGSSTSMVNNPMRSAYQKTETIARPPTSLGGGMASSGGNRVYSREVNSRLLDQFAQNSEKNNPLNSTGKKDRSGSGSISPKTMNT